MSDIKRKLATIEIIKDLQPIIDADSIEVATVRGWKVVVKKGDFKIGDVCVYCEIDSVLPSKPEFEFLKNMKYRIRTVKLRGQISQGICFPVSILPMKLNSYNIDNYKIGDDVTELLEITKYDPPIPTNLSGIVKGMFPSFLSKTDEERIQNIEFILDKYNNIEFYASEKLDGASFTIYMNNGETGVCSKNLDFKFDIKNTGWKFFMDNDLEEKLKSLNMNIALQGELIGEGIQKNKYGLKGHTIRFFNAFSIDEYKYFDFFYFKNLIHNLQLETVPIVYDNITLPKTVDELLSISEGKSALNNNQEREGLVFRPLIEINDSTIGRLSFKVISNKFLLKNKE